MKVYRKLFLFSAMASCLLCTNYACASLNKDELVAGVGTAIVFSGCMYALSKAVEKRQIAPCANASNCFRDILHSKNEKNADSVVLKRNSCWTSYSDGAIGIKKEDDAELQRILSMDKKNRSNEDKEKYAEIEWSLLHENKHVQNRDSLKICLLGGVGGAVINAAPTLPIFLASAAIFAGFTIVYKRYQEEEADRYAFAQMKPKDLNCIERYFKDRACGLETDFIKEESTSNKIGVLISRMISFFYCKIFGGNQDDQQKKIFFKTRSFFYDVQHPDYYRRAEVVQECVPKIV